MQTVIQLTNVIGIPDIFSLNRALLGESLFTLPNPGITTTAQRMHLFIVIPLAVDKKDEWRIKKLELQDFDRIALQIGIKMKWNYDCIYMAHEMQYFIHKRKNSTSWEEYTKRGIPSENAYMQMK